MGSMVERAQIIVKGIVQGVGFRPYVFNLAESLRLKGYVINTSEGVFIDIEGSCLTEFIHRLRSEVPPLCRITDFFIEKLPSHGYRDFSIRHSREQSVIQPFTLVSPDVSVCDDCIRESFDAADRRYLYPFINCTNCGPRYSITQSVPYDRPNTTMAAFTMCPDCQKEYGDPMVRRFHAQPNACAACGPEVEFRVRSSEFGVYGKEALVETIKLLKQGGIVAVKGLGGFHIACDASNDAAVKRLRENKRKSNKPFAVMAPSMEAAEFVCAVSDAEKEILRSNRRPVVLLAKRPGNHLSDAVSPKNRFIGVMLPYTPLHYLLFHHPLSGTAVVKEPHFTALVMTSGNLSEEPIVRDNDEAIKKLAVLVNGFLFHNRDIFMRNDDSVVRMRNSSDKGISGQAPCGMRNGENQPQPEARSRKSEMSFLRRSRGYVPDPIELQEDGPEVLACGADLKNTFTITRGKFAIPGQHIGDMENYETIKFFEESLANIKVVYRAEPKIIVHDLHPGYLSTKWAIECGVRGAELGVKTFAVQHHYAHIGSVMAEHGLRGRVIGVAFDGTGYGTDGNLWGSEFLVADVDGFERVGQFKYISLPGGEAAIREPWRTAVSIIMSAAGDQAWDYLERIGFIERYGKDALKNMALIARSQELSPLASGAGRLFDAVAAVLGICDRNTFEGEAAMALESLVTPGIEDAYPVEFSREKGYTVVDCNPAVIRIMHDNIEGVNSNVIATRFHNTVAMVIQTLVNAIRSHTGIRDVALSGGTFQNLYLLNKTITMLRSDGMSVFINHKVPCNDGGISLGQAFLVRERFKKS
jgi:hydrogenase maturation protein HypF